MLASTMIAVRLPASASPDPGPVSAMGQPPHFLPAPNATPMCESYDYFGAWQKLQAFVAANGNYDVEPTIDENGDGNPANDTGPQNVLTDSMTTGPGGITATFHTTNGTPDYSMGRPDIGIAMEGNSTFDAGTVNLSEPLFYSSWIFADVDLSQEGFEVRPTWLTTERQAALYGGDQWMAFRSSDTGWQNSGPGSSVNVLDFNDGDGTNHNGTELSGRVQAEFYGAINRLDLTKSGSGGAGFVAGGGCPAVGASKTMTAPAWDAATRTFSSDVTIRVRNNLPSQATLDARIAQAQASAPKYWLSAAPQSIPLTNLQLTDVLNTTGFASVTASNVQADNGLNVNPAYDGHGVTTLLAGNQALVAGTTASITMHVVYQPNFTDPTWSDCDTQLTNQADVSAVADGVTVGDKSDWGTDPRPAERNSGTSPNGSDDPTVAAFHLTCSTISGAVREDTDGNGTGDTGKSGITVALVNASNVTVATRTTGAGGSYSFTSVPPGDYHVVETVPTGYEALSDVDGGATNSIAVTTVDGVDVTGRDFVLDKLPIASDDESHANAGGTTVTLSATANDTLGDPVVPSTLDLDPSTPGRQTTRNVNGQGMWTVDDSGNVSFQPASVNVRTPTPITYSIADAEGNLTTATITVDYVLADLSVDKIGPTTYTPGSPVDYQLVAGNNGPDAVTAAVVTDPLPSGTTFDASASDNRCSASGSTVTCGPVGLSSGGSTTFAIRVSTQPSATGTLHNQASITSEVVDPVSSNNTDQVDSTPSARANLVVTKTGPAGPIAAGTSVTYHVTIHNDGPSDARSTQIADALPQGLTLVRATVLGGTGTETCGVGPTCDLGTLVPGADRTLDVIATVDPSFRGDLTNTATATTSTPGDVVADSTDDHTFNVIERADLSITKTDSADPVVAGTSFSYRLTVHNAGPSTAIGATVTDPMPSGLTITSAPGCATSGSLVSCSIDRLLPGADRTFDVTVKIDRNMAATTLHNVALVSGAADPDTSNNSDEEPTGITPAPRDLAVTIELTGGGRTVGGPAEFTVNTTNPGGIIEHGMTLNITVPDTLRVTDVLGENWTITTDNGVVTATYNGPDLPPGAEAPPIKVNGIIVRSGAVVLTAHVSGSNGASEVTYDNNASSVKVDIPQAAPSSTERGPVSPLAMTGGDAGLMTAVAFWLVVVGGGLVLRTRRRTASR